MKSFSAITAGLLVALGCASSASASQSKRGGIADCLGEKSVPVQFMNSPDYAELAEPFNLRLPYSPLVIVLPECNQHVQDAVICASRYGVKVQAKSGGHSYASYSSGGKNGSMVIDLQPMQTVSLDNITFVATVGGGVRLGNLAQGIWDQGKRAISHGTCPGVGIGGHSTHGGYGHTSRNWGIALDHIVAADVVLADGSLVHATADENSEIFWAIRGAADSFGVITTFYLRTQPAPASITYFGYQWGDTLFHDKEVHTSTFLHIQEFSKNASVVDSRISFGINLGYNAGVGAHYNLGGTFFGTVEEFKSKIEPELLRGTAPPVNITVESYEWIPYLILLSDKTDIREPLTGYDEHDTFFAKSITVPETDGLTKATLNNLFDYLTAGTPPYDYFVIINLYGGPGSAINTKDTEFAAYKDRDSLWVFQNYGIKPTTLDFINGINDVVVKSQPQTDFGAYLNYVDPTYSAQEAHKLYYGEKVLERLERLKKAVDPEHTFWHPQAIGA